MSNLYQEKKKIFLQIVVFNSNKYFQSENYYEKK